MRKPIIAGNWKMNKTNEEAKAFVEAVKGKLPSADLVEAVVGVPALVASDVKASLAGSNLGLAVQNCYFEDAGAFTGETSPASLKALGVDLLGRLRRRLRLSRGPCASPGSVDRKSVV